MPDFKSLWRINLPCGWSLLPLAASHRHWFPSARLGETESWPSQVWALATYRRTVPPSNSLAGYLS
jgi:hypothetical protein